MLSAKKEKNKISFMLNVYYLSFVSRTHVGEGESERMHANLTAWEQNQI